MVGDAGTFAKSIVYLRLDATATASQKSGTLCWAGACEPVRSDRWINPLQKGITIWISDVR